MLMSIRLLHLQKTSINTMPKKKFIKIVNSDIVFIGFPDSTLNTILDLCTQKGFAVNKNDKLITIELKKKEGFSKWKDEIEIADSNKRKEIDTSLIEQIASFPLATKTPMEAQQFLYKLQMELNGNYYKTNNLQNRIIFERIDNKFWNYFIPIFAI